jgi:hypothetical protein
MHKAYKILQLLSVSVIMLTLMSACATEYSNRNPVGLMFPDISGQTLNEESFRIPEDLPAQKTLLLIGYRQNAQFDIDRWMIGLDMTGTDIPFIELPTIQGFFPRLFSSRIDEGMRSGIPDELWSAVVTVYEDGARVQSFTGNEKPNNARVVLLDNEGKVIYFYDRGFSVDALNRLRTAIELPES